MLETLKSTQRAGGLRALYRGYGVSALAIGAYKSLYFGLYDTAVAAMEQVGAMLGEGVVVLLYVAAPSPESMDCEQASTPHDWGGAGAN